MSSCDDHELIVDTQLGCEDMENRFPCEQLYANKNYEIQASCAKGVDYDGDSEFSGYEDDEEESMVNNVPIKFVDLSFYQHKRTILLSQYQRFLCKHKKDNYDSDESSYTDGFAQDNGDQVFVAPVLKKEEVCSIKHEAKENENEI